MVSELNILAKYEDFQTGMSENGTIHITMMKNRSVHPWISILALKMIKAKTFRNQGVEVGNSMGHVVVFTLGGLGILFHKVDILGTTRLFDTNYWTYCLSSI